VYFECHTFDFLSPGNCNIETIAALVKKAKINDPVENARAIRATREAEEKEQQQKRYDKIKDLMPAYGSRAANIGGRVKATKSASTPKTANELGLPLRGATQIHTENHHASR
jgi:DNA-binding protein H-NS